MSQFTNSKSLVCFVWLSLFVMSLIAIYYPLLGMIVGAFLLFLIGFFCFIPTLTSEFKAIYMNQLSSLLVYLSFIIVVMALVHFNMVLLAALFGLCIKIIYPIYCLVIFIQSLFSSRSDLSSQEGGF